MHEKRIEIRWRDLGTAEDLRSPARPLLARSLRSRRLLPARGCWPRPRRSVAAAGRCPVAPVSTGAYEHVDASIDDRAPSCDSRTGEERAAFESAAG